jgi:hypothetical protein
MAAVSDRNFQTLARLVPDTGGGASASGSGRHADRRPGGDKPPTLTTVTHGLGARRLTSSLRPGRSRHAGGVTIITVKCTSAGVDEHDQHAGHNEHGHDRQLTSPGLDGDWLMAKYTFQWPDGSKAQHPVGAGAGEPAGEGGARRLDARGARSRTLWRGPRPMVRRRPATLRGSPSTPQAMPCRRRRAARRPGIGERAAHRQPERRDRQGRTRRTTPGTSASTTGTTRTARSTPRTRTRGPRCSSSGMSGQARRRRTVTPRGASCTAARSRTRGTRRPATTGRTRRRTGSATSAGLHGMQTGQLGTVANAGTGVRTLISRRY